MDIDLLTSLHSRFGFNSFRPGQQEAISGLLAGRDTLVVMPTGSGKSLIYQLAALHLLDLTLVISPLIALMKDQVDSLRRHNIPATFINSSLPGIEQDQRLRDIGAGKYRLVFIAPERLRSVQFVKILERQKVSLLAVDEAHCISVWEHDFRPDYLHIAGFRQQIGLPLTAALTATATPKVQDDIIQSLGLSNPHKIVTGFNRPNLSLEVQYFTSLPQKLSALNKLLPAQKSGAAIVYTGTRQETEQVADFINRVVGRKACYYHAGLPNDERTRIQNSFIGGELSFVVATNAFGMGIDRPDVRQVIHFSIPGSLEAYYQEAGRAGRDGEPARAVLFYAPEDRALQEWFIQSSTIDANDLRRVYDVLRLNCASHETITVDDISSATGFPEIKTRVGLAGLEQAGAIEHLGVSGISLKIKLRAWDGAQIGKVAGQLKAHQAHRKMQLDHMLSYAESNQCRRRIILNHFGDTGSPEAEVCCDNCQKHGNDGTVERTPRALSPVERDALLILDTVNRQKIKLGREKICQILKGSKAKDILQFGYHKCVYYGRLAGHSSSEIMHFIDSLTEKGYLKSIGGKYPVLQLTNLGEQAIRDKLAIPVNPAFHKDQKTAHRARAVPMPGRTIEYTFELYEQGYTVEQIAKQRELNVSTIFNHLVQLSAAGRITVSRLMSDEVYKKVEEAIRKVGSVDLLSPLKALLPDDISYDVIRLVVQDWKQRNPPAATGLQDRKGENPSPPPADPVAAFLSSPHPARLPGPWMEGWAMDFHSQFSGASWNRSRTGELVYRLKYLEDQSVLPELVEQAESLIHDKFNLDEVEAVAPVPPSVPRSNDPVSSFAQALAKKRHLTYLSVLVKSRQTRPQKEMLSLAKKRANVAGAFVLQSTVKGRHVLVVDDLFDSGATLEEITRLLLRCGASSVRVLALTRTIHSDA